MTYSLRPFVQRARFSVHTTVIFESFALMYWVADPVETFKPSAFSLVEAAVVVYRLGAIGDAFSWTE